MWLSLIVAGLLAQAPAGGPDRASADLLDAVRAGDAVRAAAAAAAGARIDVADGRGMTPLMLAAAAGSLPIVELLLDRGARVNFRAPDGSTALACAAESGAGTIVTVLLARGADVAAARGGATPQALARARGHIELADRLAHAETLGADLLRAARAGSTTLVRQLLALGAPVNTSDERGMTVLMLAAADGHLGLLQYLIARGADPAQQDDQGRTAFDWAERSPGIGPHVAAYLTARGLRRANAAPVRAAPPIRESLQALDAVLNDLRATATPPTGAQARAARALAELTTLSARWPAESPEDYRAGLGRLVAFVQDAAAKDDPRVLDAALEALADDLEIKLQHCLASGGKLGGSVLVRIRARRGADEVRNWQVLYMPRIFETSPTARPDLFPRLSSPSEELLVPGRYLVWLREPTSGFVTPREIIRVGEGRKELDVDLPLPSDAPQ